MIYVKAVSYALSGSVNQIKGFISLHRSWQRSHRLIRYSYCSSYLYKIKPRTSPQCGLLRSFCCSKVGSSNNDKGQVPLSSLEMTVTRKVSYCY